MSLPSVLYRVFDDDSASQYHFNDGFRASDQNWDCNDWKNSEKMAEAIRRHLDWSNRIGTPFISTSASLEATRRETNRRYNQGKQNIRVAEINGWRLASENVRMEKVEALVNLHRVTGAQFVTTTEYLCLGHIPHSSVRKIWDFGAFDDHCGIQGFNSRFCGIIPDF